MGSNLFRGNPLLPWVKQNLHSLLSNGWFNERVRECFHKIMASNLIEPQALDTISIYFIHWLIIYYTKNNKVYEWVYSTEIEIVFRTKIKSVQTNDIYNKSWSSERPVRSERLKFWWIHLNQQIIVIFTDRTDSK